MPFRKLLRRAGVPRSRLRRAAWLARLRPLPRLSLLAVVAGLAAGTVILAFRAALEAVGALHGGIDHFETLPPAVRLLLPIAGALAIGLLCHRLPAESLRLGVVHVMERLARHQGRMPWAAAGRQFGGNVFALNMGLSGGHEGPAVHLGAAASSLVGQALDVRPDELRNLVACGAAAAIAASFNTPLAGVIFAMEVVLMEYTILGFVPVIIATVTATVLARWAFGSATIFLVPPSDLASLAEVPVIVLAGLAVGLVGGAFILLVEAFSRLERWPFWVRATTAGAITGALALVAPAVLGIGYDTVDAALLGQIAWGVLLLTLVAKIIATAACVGLGLPVGIIGPTLVMGAVLGGIAGDVLGVVVPQWQAEAPLYVVLGMAAMMAAVLQAPLAGLAAVLELTGNPNIILPAMLIVVVAMLTVRIVFRRRSVFLTTLRSVGIRYPPRSGR